MSECLQVITTTESREDALAIAREAVQTQAAACAQVFGPVTSVFRWKGRVEEEEEHLCFMKTTRSAWDHLESVIRERHPYEVPEIIAVPIETGGADYLDWIRRETAPATGP